VRSTRDDQAVKRSLARLKDTAARPDENIMPATTECVRAYATVGEIFDALRDVFGVYEEPLSAIFG
jgi:methylmalonyl-CoA mutase N-terminal domain/subunit